MAERSDAERSDAGQWEPDGLPLIYRGTMWQRSPLEGSYDFPDGLSAWDLVPWHGYSYTLPGETPIEALDLKPRTWWALHRCGITTVPQLWRLGPGEVSGYRNIGPLTLAEISRKMGW